MKKKKEYCDYMAHWKRPNAYSYTCKKCHNTEDRKVKPYPDGSWCHCECKHNIFTCKICWKPVRIVHGIYWFVSKNIERG